jgi:hypothetical protein
MGTKLLIQLLALSLYSWWMGFCFCDGFKLHVVRKLIWFAAFAGISVSVLQATGEYDLALILPIPSLLALTLAWMQKRQEERHGFGPRLKNGESGFIKDTTIMSWVLLACVTSLIISPELRSRMSLDFSRIPEQYRYQPKVVGKVTAKTIEIFRGVRATQPPTGGKNNISDLFQGLLKQAMSAFQNNDAGRNSEAFPAIPSIQHNN